MSRSMLLIALVGLFSSQMLAQTTPPQPPTTSASVPIYRVSVVGRTTPAINYLRRVGSKVDLVGTALMPEANGLAEVSAKSGHTEIDARFRGLQPASRFGAEYLTYVLWAITPEGRARNLGDVQRQGDKARKEVTTELQAFALIVTAEPYFAVTQPSDVVVMENVLRADTTGTVETMQAKYELLPRGSYLMNRPADFSARPHDPDVPLELAEARNAIELARMAGANQYASETFIKAARLLAEAQVAREKQSTHATIAAARQSAQTAEDARLIAIKRQEEEFAVQQQATIAEREAQALRERLRADSAQLEAARQAQNAAREAQNAAAAHSDVERERLELARTRDELQQTRIQALRAQAQVAVAEYEKKELRAQLREQLNMFLETRESARGLIMNVPDVLFDTASARLTSEAREKLARVSGILAAQPELRITIEGHTDDVGDDAANLRLSEQRANAVLVYLVEQKVPLNTADIAGLGEARPVAPNDTPHGRQQNRRVELIVSGEPIGVPTSSDTPQ